MKILPTYELLVVELQATLESLIKYSKSESVKESAKKRKIEIEQIRKTGGRLYLEDHPVKRFVIK
jgi:hypothetical protein